MPVYAFGSNGSGQLGIGHTDDVNIPTRCLFFGSAATSVQDSSTANTIDNDQENPDLNAPFRRIAAGGNHTVILCASGAAYAAGLNGDGRCGVVDSNSFSNCGSRPADGVEVSSSSESGPGNGDDEAQLIMRFARVRLAFADGRVVDQFADVTASWAATVFVSQRGDEIYVVGSGDKGELGLGEGITAATASTPGIIPDFPPAGLSVKAVSSGMSHVVCALSNGQVYGWGAARKGQLGRAATSLKTLWTPTRIEDVAFHADGAACGREFTIVFNHASGEYLVLGSDKWGIVSGAAAELELQDSRVFASWHGVYIHNNANKSLIAWGRNDRGQLPPSSLSGQVAQFAAGSEHGVVLLSDQSTVVSFGWGEHGNCGAAVDSQGNVRDRVNEIPLPLTDDERVVGLAAGCATSWIMTRHG